MVGSFLSWLIQTRIELPPRIKDQLRAGLYGSVPIFLGGVLNSIAIAALAASRQPGAEFRIWLAVELSLGLTRLPVLVWSRYAVAAGRRPLEKLTVLLSCAWSGSVGFGAFICLTSNDWVLSSIICLSTAAMVCGICLRNFGTPRLAATMMFLALAPCALAGLLTSETVFAIISIQLPIFMLTIFASAFALHRILVSKMKAVSDLEKSEFFTRTILESSPDYTLILDGAGKVVFCNHPNAEGDSGASLLGRSWLDLLPAEDREEGARVLADAAAGLPGTMVTYHTDRSGRTRWFHTAANTIADDSGRTIVVARDITSQKNSEDRALWMARHDPLTGLPNRTVLQDRLDALLSAAEARPTAGLLLLDVDNFKTVNDTLGHDAGDALLCAFADRLREAVDDSELVARTGGDEFALIIGASTDADLESAARRIYKCLHKPYFHHDRVLECSASVGGSLLPRDGATRSEIMKAADIALYAAKAAGRAQLKIFEPAMMTNVLKRDAMRVCARTALEEDRVVPWFQPKVSLRTREILGFEALLRWNDASGVVRSPEHLRAAFDDPVLGSALSDRMLERVLNLMAMWRRQRIAFRHVSINATAGDFHRHDFADKLLCGLHDRDLPTSSLQVEVTETVFLGRDANAVGAALKTLSYAGVRVALDDFGTGYASLSHLNQFPVDLLKIDQSFVRQLSRTAEAAAIVAAIVNLGHCLGMEIVAEGVETQAQATRLLSMGCDAAQGYLYSCAVPADEVPTALGQWEAPLAMAVS